MKNTEHTDHQLDRQAWKYTQITKKLGKPSRRVVHSIGIDWHLNPLLPLLSPCIHNAYVIIRV